MLNNFGRCNGHGNKKAQAWTLAYQGMKGLPAYIQQKQDQIRFIDQSFLFKINWLFVEWWSNLANLFL